jgi:hypothetical protein
VQDRLFESDFDRFMALEAQTTAIAKPVAAKRTGKKKP